MVFYRKYRPQIIDELDNKDVRETLLSVLSQETPSHAFLFTGPKGLGKTSSARIIAKVVNCTAPLKKRKNGIEPCGECESCVSIMNGTNMDILEIDAASNRGIDEIRDLKEKIRLSPLSSKMKVYIIDEVHMLTTEAFNALLKTLEEPPSHAMFVLCTTEPQKVPATILSRCFHISFKKATDEELVRSFERIAKGEKITVEKDALSYIAKLSDGAFRDGAKILEEMSLLANKKPLTKELIEEKYKYGSIDKSVSDMITFFKEKNVKEGLTLISALVERGVDMRYFTQQLLESLHLELLTNIQNETKQEHAGIEEIKSLMEILMDAYADSKFAVIQQLPLELAIIEWAQRDIQPAIVSETIREVVITNEGEVSVSSLRKKVGNIKKITAMYGAEKKAAEAKSDTSSTRQKVTLLQTANSEITKEWLNLFWTNLISEIKSYNHTIAGVLRGCSISNYDKNLLVIETAYKFHKERLTDPKTLRELSRIAKLLTGRDVKVEVQLRRD
jgi:DNA polymerase III subunit gamma/tau